MSAGVPLQLFRPASIVIVGASADPSKLSSIPLQNLQRLGYPGRIYVVNPREKEIGGVASFPDIASLPETPELAFLVVPGERALQAATDCARRGVAAAVVASTGFAEAGGEGIDRQHALTALRASHGMRIVGPNTNGIYSAHDGLSLGYNSAHAEAFTPGSVSVVSHSGALFNTIAERLRSGQVGLSKFVAVGNEADLDMLEFFDHLAGDDTTRTILLVMEAVRDGERFRAIAHKARAAGKRIAALKLGTSSAGAASTAAHSSRLAGSARAYAALFESAGVGMVGTVEALVAFARLAGQVQPGWKPAARRGFGFGLGLVTASGAGGTLLADASSDHGFEVAEVSGSTADALRAFNESAQVFNPLDVASFGSSKSTPLTAPLLSADAGIDAVVAFAHKLQTKAQRDAFTNGIGDGFGRTGKPHMAVSPGGLPADQAALFEARRIPVFADTGSAFEGLRALFQTAAAASAVAAMPPGLVEAGATLSLNEFASMAELDEAGIATVPRAFVKSADEAIAFAKAHGWPVVLKGVVDGIAHKSDIGLVRLDLDSETKLRDAHASLRSSIAEATGKAAPDERSIVAQKMIRGGFELIAGVTTEAPLGRFLLVGLGGRQAEVLDDVRLWAMPVSEEALREGLAQTTAGRVVLGKRWSRTQSFDEIAAVLMRLQAYAMKQGAALRAIEINPLSIGNAAPVALDALVIRAAPDHMTPPELP